MKFKKLTISIVSLATIFTLIGCANNKKDNDGINMDHSKMEHSDSSELPKGLKVAENPTFEVGSKAEITEGHMEGMKGAEATIVGAYDTIAYVVTYMPSKGGEKVPNHKWVIQEEISEADDNQIEPGSAVMLNADHMEGMNGAKATIDSAEKTTVYMIDFKPTNGGETVKNHKWVTESELAPLK